MLCFYNIFDSLNYQVFIHFSFPIVNTKLHGMFWKYLHCLLLDDPTCPSSFYSYVSGRYKKLAENYVTQKYENQ